MIISFLLAVCPFCDPVFLEKATYYEGEMVRGVGTYKPMTEGHVLIIPKRHVERFEELTKEECAEIFEVIKKTNAAVREVYDTSAYLLLEKNGEEALQEVPHVHFHYIPRKEGENRLSFIFRIVFRALFPPISPEEERANAERLSQAMK